MPIDYYPGMGCTCSAWAKMECACDVDWTETEVYKLRNLCTRSLRALRYGNTDEALIADLSTALENKQLKDVL